MIRPLTVSLILIALSAGAATSTGASTHFRKHHVLYVEARAGQEIRLTATAIRASLGYPDALAYRMYGPDGRSAAQGRLEPGEEREFTLKPREDGLYVLDCNPGKNAFRLDIQGAAWAVDISATRQLNVIDHARPLYVHVPGSLPELRLTFNGESATMKLLRPDGGEALNRKLPQYEKVSVTCPVGPGQAGWWRLDLDLSEDQGILFPKEIPPFVSEAPLTPRFLRALQTGQHLVDFDLRPTPRQQLVAVRGQVSHMLATQDGLELGLSEAGQLVKVNCDGQRLDQTEDPTLMGFYVRDVARDSDLIALTGDTRTVGDDVHADYNATDLDLSVHAEYTPAADHIGVEVTVRNERPTDRAVTVYFVLPFPVGEALWWDDIVTQRPATGNRTLGARGRVSAGANGRHSTYPFACVSGQQCPALAIPMDYPLCHRLAAAPACRRFFLAVDLGLTPATAKFPNRATYTFVVYRCDPRWGLRSAVARYYRLFPQFFTKRMPQDGGWVCWGTCAGMANLDALGFLYHWGPSGPEAIAFDDANGLYSFLYSDSARYFADVGQFNRRPNASEAAAAMRRLLDAADPRSHVLSARETATGRRRYLSREKSRGREATETWLRDSVAAVKASAALNSHGDIQVGYLVNRKDWGGEDWWTGRCFANIDPDIPGGYGQFLLDRVLSPIVDKYRRAGAELDGFGLDNYFTNAASLDFSRKHLAWTDFPATFATADFRPVIVGDTIVYEWVRELKRRLEAEGKWLIANTGRQPFPFAQHLLDMNGLEWGLERSAPAARVLAYRKQVVTLPVKPEHYKEPFIKSHLPMGVLPGGYGGDKRFRLGSETAELYAKYVPILRRMAAAGWEPVPWAEADAETVSVERFGTTLPLLFSVHNQGSEPMQATISVDVTRLGAEQVKGIRDLVTALPLEVTRREGQVAFTVTLPAGDATVLEIR
ncbi:MAG: hypothetical protein HN742_12715 [Lentisphaerae bacterium]|nr:hypothetical protein [Lentisphaerota bacterium]MBT4823005.1 hypothetical protein [Lentisphaerota bacterium]MBT5610428.1 hypothetical protein [Lentisphaerota bacterium]MBT7053513.1 hypothetical protein [Lentisphaerota bacterium]MBT7842731.1 hypothetical protein [Lentisphaerota bacterium]